MKIRLVVALVGLAISLALPTFAQQKEPTPSDENRKVSAALIKQGDDAFNNNDPAALVAMFTEDSVLVAPEGPIYGREAIAKFWIDLFKQVHFSNKVTKDDQVSPHVIGHQLWCNGEWSQTVIGQNFGPIEQKGHYCAIDSREGDTWKLRMLTWNVAPEPVAPAQAK